MNTLVVGPHPDDELLGCGGTLLRRVSERGNVGWLLLTSMAPEDGWMDHQIVERSRQIAEVREGIGIDVENLFSLGFPAAGLDSVPMKEMVSSISEVFKKFRPKEVLLPYAGDVHSDHRIAFQATAACAKWFRNDSVERVLAYETLSETDFAIDPTQRSFSPNVFINIDDFLEKKIDLLGIYSSEIAPFPFPRSREAVEALARFRGSQAGYRAAEGFMLLAERH
jgi:LmbE family N-acetylglucosaminyl deacetylase